MRWYFPSWNGDIRIRATDDGKRTVMTVIEPTAYELEVLAGCEGLFGSKGWIETAPPGFADVAKGRSHGEPMKLWRLDGDPASQETILGATLLEVGSILLGRLKPGIATLTAVTDENGSIQAMGSGEAGFAQWLSAAMQGGAGAVPASVNFRDTDGYAERQAKTRAEAEAAQRAQAEAERAKADAEIARLSAEVYSQAEGRRKAENEREKEAEARRKAEEKARKADEKAKEATAETGAAKAEAAVTVKRATPCCPQSVPGVVGSAQEVLLAFCDQEQRHQWLTERRLVARGGITGHRYLLAHRNSPTAMKIGKICYDLDSENPLHFHDWTVPPEEEILAAKLILEHREPWLRNEATFFGWGWDGKSPIKFKNPFGDGGDGVPDSSFTEKFGRKLLGRRWNYVECAG